ncbi:MAG: hypothetical protein ACRCXT_20620 [Paraclostridium sp.]
MFISGFTSEYQLLEKIGRGFYSNNAITFNINTNESQFNADNILNNISKDQVLYKIISSNTRLVYFNSDKYEIPLIEGRTLFKDDFNSNTDIVLSGRNRLNEINSNQTIVGTIGTNVDSKLDNLILMALKPSNINNMLDGVWVIDGKNDVDKSYNNIKNSVTSLEVSIDKIPSIDSGISRLFNNKQLNNAIYILLFMMFISCLLTLLIYLLLIKKDDIKIMITCGLTTSEILNECFSKKIYKATIFYLCGLFIAYILYFAINNYWINYKILLLTTVIFITASILCIFIFIKLWVYNYIRRVKNDF